jgi:uncharacterized protein
MSVHLLDVNVLVALMWPAHVAHGDVQDWFSKHAKRGWATCPFTQAALVRILSNPSFSSDSVTPQQALTVLSANLKHPNHKFWADDLNLVESVEPFRQRLMGHRQITDAYLLGLAMRHKGKLATMDRGILVLQPAVERDNGTVVVI